ncbi:adenine specific DNA methyltransferase (plasmid) [Borreliella garinii Far04]|nr:adenine specific DNA methyltransferase [Borreliella garinii Far04]
MHISAFLLKEKRTNIPDIKLVFKKFSSYNINFAYKDLYFSFSKNFLFKCRKSLIKAKGVYLYYSQLPIPFATT